MATTDGSNDPEAEANQRDAILAPEGFCLHLEGDEKERSI